MPVEPSSLLDKPVVTDVYSEMALGANNSRLIQMTYGWDFEFMYGSTGSVDDRISRLDEVWALDTEWLELLTYLGTSTVVTKEFNANNVTLTYVGSSAGPVGDKYVGLDQFGRVAEQKWVEGSTAKVDYGYGYDRDGNRLYQEDLVSSAMSEVYTYDGLNQLTGFQRGVLNSTKTGITGTVYASATYSPDAAGNLGTANRQNELAALTYDADGNAITDDNSHTLTYDAWNRLVDVKSGSTVLSGYSYDALSRRITETHSGTTTILMVSASDQVVADDDGTTLNTYLWDPTTTDAPVFRDAYNYSTSAETQSNALTTANGDVAALVNAAAFSGAVVERYAYTPYGQVSYLTASYGSLSSSSYNWQYLHQGLRWDSIADLYDNRARAYSPTLMRFLQDDPMEFGAGDPNFYRYVGDSPVDFTDPTGLQKRRISNRYKAQLDFNCDFTDEEMDVVQKTFDLAGDRISNALIALRDYREAIEKSAIIQPTPDAKPKLEPRWVQLNRRWTEAISMGSHGGAGHVDHDAYNMYLNRLNTVRGKLTDPNNVISLLCWFSRKWTSPGRVIVKGERLTAMVL